MLDILLVNLYPLVREMTFARPRHFFMTIFIKIIAFRERKKIFKKPKITKFNFILDSSLFSNRYGDFFYSCFLCRFMLKSGRKIKFIFILDKKIVSKSMLKEYKDIFLTLLNKFDIQFEIREKNSFDPKNIKNKLFSNFVDNGLPIYEFIYQLISNIYLFSRLKNSEEFFLTSSDLYKKEFKKYIIKENKYITLPCRFDNEIGINRNLKKNEFYSLLEVIRNNFPKEKIIVVSDINGCNYFKKIQSTKFDNIIYSKDIYPENSFLFDAYLILRSSLLIKLRGGGITVPSLFSEIPYFISSINRTSLRISKNKLTPWSLKNKNQFFYRSETLNLPLLNKFLIDLNKG